MTPVRAEVVKNIKNVVVSDVLYVFDKQNLGRNLEENILTEMSDSLTVPGFLANGVHVGIKTDRQKDLALIFSSTPAQAVGMFTTNAFKAAPVLVDMERIKSGMAQAILVNSGNANAASGKEGHGDALAMSRAASNSLKIRDELVLVASTGIIGQRLPVKKIIGGMKGLVSGLRSEGIADAEEAIMTTDKFPKMFCRKALIGTKEITLCGIAKGAGMIEPNMATMLAFMMTDADIEPSLLQGAFRRSVHQTFNAISVDGCMSTNDTVIMLANGVAGNKSIRRGTKECSQFKEMLFMTMDALSRAIVRDGEGATKVIEVTVQDAKSRSEARKAAYAIANSNLVKTAFFGSDPNWGRIISAVGSAGIVVSAEAVKVFFEDVPVFANGSGLKGYEKKLTEIMARSSIRLRIYLGTGKQQFTLLASDLGYDYVKINAHYHT